MSEVRSKHIKEKVDTTKTFKAEIKHWKKELGEERKLKINLMKKIEATKLAENDVDEHQTINKTSPKLFSEFSSSSNKEIHAKSSFPASASETVSSQTDYTSDIPYGVTSLSHPSSTHSCVTELHLSNFYQDQSQALTAFAGVNLAITSSMKQRKHSINNMTGRSESSILMRGSGSSHCGTGCSRGWSSARIKTSNR